MLKKDKAAGGTIFCMFFAYAVIFVSMFFSYYTFYKSSMIALKENVNNSMKEANLAAMTIDLDSYSYSYDYDAQEFKVSPYLIDTSEANSIYVETISSNLNLERDADGTYVPIEGTRWTSFVSSVEILDFVLLDAVYVDSSELQITARDTNGWRELVYNYDTGFYELGGTVPAPMYCSAGEFKTPDGTIVESPSVYSQIQLNITSGVLGNHEYIRHNTTSIVTK